MEQLIVLVMSLVSVVAGMALCLEGLIPRWTHLRLRHRHQPPPSSSSNHTPAARTSPVS